MTSVAEIAADREHGAAWLSLRAVELLRDTATTLAERGAHDATARRELGALGMRLRAAQPAMAVLRVRVDRLLHDWQSGARPGDAGALASLASAALREHALAEERAARAAAAHVAGRRVLTLSRSATVHATLLAADPPAARVLVARSLPGGEGEQAAADLRTAALAAILIEDDAVAGARASDADVLLVGADSVLGDGTVINKVGTLAAARAMRARGGASYAVATSDKIAPAGFVTSAGGLFEATPAALWTAVVTERGPLAGAEIARLADAHARLADWIDEIGGPPSSMS